MARIAAVNIPNKAHVVIGLQSIYGIGPVSYTHLTLPTILLV